MKRNNFKGEGEITWLVIELSSTRYRVNRFVS